jgi:hypothetical protein
MTTFTTDEIDLAALLIVTTEQLPKVEIHSYRSLFSFDQTEAVNQATLAYAAGTATCNARDLMRARRSLFNRIRGGGHGR